MDDQLKELTNALVNLRVEIAKIDTKVDSFKDIATSVIGIDKRLTAAEASASQAHKRMDRIEKVHAWIAMSIGGGLIAALITFIVKGGLVK